MGDVVPRGNVSILCDCTIIYFSDKRCPRINIQLGLFYSIDSSWFFLHAQFGSWCSQRVRKEWNSLLCLLHILHCLLQRIRERERKGRKQTGIFETPTSTTDRTGTEWILGMDLPGGGSHPRRGTDDGRRETGHYGRYN